MKKFSNLSIFCYLYNNIRAKIDPPLLSYAMPIALRKGNKM